MSGEQEPGDTQRRSELRIVRDRICVPSWPPQGPEQFDHALHSDILQAAGRKREREKERAEVEARDKEIGTDDQRQASELQLTKRKRNGRNRSASFIHLIIQGARKSGNCKR